MKCVKSEIPCIITGSHDAVIVCQVDRHGKPLRTVINQESGLVFTDPRPDHEDVREFYSNLYRQEYKGTAVPKLKHVYRAGCVALERWGRIAPFIKQGDQVLDAGAGGGELMYLLGKRNCVVSGIEPNRGYAIHAINTYGADIQVGFFEDAKFKESFFDVILLFHVLEHLENPALEIERLRSFLKPEGTFIIEVPNVTYSQGYPTAKWHIGHLYNFNKATLTATAIKAGMNPVEVLETGDGGNLFGVFQKTTPLAECDLRGNFDVVFQRLRSHTIARHLMSSHPYVRPVKKLIRAIHEQVAIKGFQDSRDVLDKLYANSFKA